MKMPRIRGYVRRPPRPILGIVALLVMSGYAGDLWAHHDEELHRPVGHPVYVTEPPNCGVRLSNWLTTDGDVSLVRVIIAVDKAGSAGYERSDINKAYSLLRDLATDFDEFGIKLQAVGLRTWVSSDHLASVSNRLDEVEEAVSLVGADIVLALTRHEAPGADGAAVIGGRYALVSWHDSHPERDLWVAAHEIGHLFGARHSEPAPGGIDVMAPSGFGSRIRWSQCHKDLMRTNAHRFD